MPLRNTHSITARAVSADMPVRPLEGSLTVTKLSISCNYGWSQECRYSISISHWNTHTMGFSYPGHLKSLKTVLFYSQNYAKIIGHWLLGYASSLIVAFKAARNVTVPRS